MMKSRYLFYFVLGVLTFFGCEKNNPPEILEIKVIQKDASGGSLFILTAQAFDSDKDLLSYSWTCEAGEFPEGSTLRQVKWFAPFSLTNKAYTIELSVSDGVETVRETTQIEFEIPENFEFTDNRDGNRYLALRIGSQTWMLGNLAYLPSVSPSSIGSDYTPYFYVYDYEDSIVSTAKTTDYYKDYGVLYNWEAAKTACPSGWHLPGDLEWQIFEEYFGISSKTNAGISSGDIGLKIKSTSGWQNNGNGDNRSGFNALPAGTRTNGIGFDGLGFFTYFWSSTTYGYTTAYDRHTSHTTSEVLLATNLRRFGFSVRCLQD